MSGQQDASSTEIRHAMVGEDMGRGYPVGTASGKPYWPADPRPEDIRPFDLAVQLSRICRFNGALDPSITGIYSVAQHLVHCCDLAQTEHKLEALLHDAHEAYVHDIVKPFKMMLGDYADFEELNERVLRKRFGLPKKMTPAVEEIDRRMAATEFRDVAPTPHESLEWGEMPRPFSIKIVPWVPSQARAQFLNRLNSLWSD